MLAPQPFFEPRGTPISVYQRLQGLSALGHQVDVVTYHVGEDVDFPGVRLHRTPRIPFIKKVKIGPSLVKIPLDMLLFWTAFWMLLRRRYDVIHSHEEAAFMAVPLSFLFRTRHLYDMHSSLPRQLDNFKFGNYPAIIRLFEALENGVIRTCDVVLTIGLDLEQHVLQTKASANHIRIENTALNNSIQVDAAAAADIRRQMKLDDRPTLVYTGTLERYQGLDLLLDSLKIVVRTRPEAALVIVGGKPAQVEDWRREAESRGLQDSVIFTGLVPVEKSLLYLEMADLLVSPRSQGLSVPLKIYTYLYSGRPIVATRIPAHTQVLNETNAVLADPEADAYASALLKLIENPALRAQIGAAGRAYAETEFSLEKYLEKLNLAYRSLQLSEPIRQLQALGG
jgi:glycosyltransferase involved in cell wall biosynthesis